jgi:YesN/AraC family two-component response regulator
MNKKEEYSLLEKWTGAVVGKMHVHQVTLDDLGKELNFSRGYLSMVLNGRRRPEGIRQRVEAALDAVIERKKAQG